MPTLYAIADELLALNGLLDEREGDISDPDVSAAFDAWFDEIAQDQASKLESCVGLLSTWEMEIVAAKSEVDQWAAKVRTREKRRDHFKARLKQFLELTGQPKATTSHGRTLSIRANGGKLPLDLDDPLDPAKVPDSLCRIRREIDRAAVIAALEAGEDLPFARLLPRGSHLRIG